jgi:integrase
LFLIASAKRRKTTLSALPEIYYLHHPCLRAGTLDQYDRAARSFCKFCGRDLSISEIRKPNVLRWIAQRLKEVSPRTVKRERGDLLTLWRFAWAEGYHKENPDTLSIPTVRCPKKSPTAWHLDQLQKWIEAAGRLRGNMRGTTVSKADWWRAYILFLYRTASRPSAARLVRPVDVDLEHGFVVLRAEVSKTGHDDICRLNEQVIEAIRKIYDPESKYIFYWPYHPDKIWRLYKQISESAGLPTDRYHSIGCMRRTTASLVAANGSVEMARQLLGHASADTTLRHYLDPKIAFQNSAVDVLPNIEIH